MTSFIGRRADAHDRAEKIGVLLVNLGTPDEPSTAAVRRYLKEFLSDGRVVEAPRWLWWFILRGKVLPFRPRRTAAAYRQIWREDGSPLLTISLAQRDALRQSFSGGAVQVALGMRYGAPSIDAALRELEAANCRRLAVLPLYPQYAGSTVGSVFDEVAACLARRRWVPHLRFISGYGERQGYIDALADSIAVAQRAHGVADQLLFSFHGTPAAMLLEGDPYHCFCHQTARRTAEKLGLTATQWRVTFQSRFGRAVWLQPYTDATLRALPQQGVSSVQVVCPAFAADCLETLEEIAVENRDIFLQAGGVRYDYIPALNAEPSHIKFLHELITETIADWLPAVEDNERARPAGKTAYEQLRERSDYLNAVT